MDDPQLEETRDRLLEKARRYRQQARELDGNTIHGGETAVRQLTLGLQFTGPMVEIANEVENDLEIKGLLEVVRTGAIRLETVARLYYLLCVEAAERGDLKDLDTRVQRFGWLATSAMRAWRQLEESKQAAADVLDYEKLLEQQRGDGDH